MDFETKLAAAGETLEKLAAEHGLNLGDFTEQETVDLLTTIMGEDGAKVAFSEEEDPSSLNPLQGFRRGQMVGRPGEGVLRDVAGGGFGATAGGVHGALTGAGLGLGTAMLAGKNPGAGALIGAGLGGLGGGVLGGAMGRDMATRGMVDEARQREMLQILQAQQAAEAAKSASLTYGEVMHEVAKVAAANGYDISQASPAELDDAVQKMAALLSNPEYLVKQAALQEKIAEADAMGRVMAHAYVDELGKLASSHEETEEEKKEREKKEEKKEEEKKASFYRSVKSAGEMPAALKEHMKKKHEGKEDEDEEEEEKKASFAKAASLRAAELLILNGINPDTGYKFASQQEALDAGAALVLQSKGYI